MLTSDGSLRDYSEEKTSTGSTLNYVYFPAMRRNRDLVAITDKLNQTVESFELLYHIDGRDDIKVLNELSQQIDDLTISSPIKCQLREFFTKFKYITVEAEEAFDEMNQILGTVMKWFHTLKFPEDITDVLDYIDPHYDGELKHDIVDVKVAFDQLMLNIKSGSFEDVNNLKREKKEFRSTAIQKFKEFVDQAVLLKTTAKGTGSSNAKADFISFWLHVEEELYKLGTELHIHDEHEAGEFHKHIRKVIHEVHKKAHVYESLVKSVEDYQRLEEKWKEHNKVLMEEKVSLESRISVYQNELKSVRKELMTFDHSHACVSEDDTSEQCLEFFDKQQKTCIIAADRVFDLKSQLNNAQIEIADLKEERERLMEDFDKVMKAQIDELIKKNVQLTEINKTYENVQKLQEENLEHLETMNSNVTVELKELSGRNQELEYTGAQNKIRLTRQQNEIAQLKTKNDKYFHDIRELKEEKKHLEGVAHELEAVQSKKHRMKVELEKLKARYNEVQHFREKDRKELEELHEEKKKAKDVVCSNLSDQSFRIEQLQVESKALQKKLYEAMTKLQLCEVDSQQKTGSKNQKSRKSIKNRKLSGIRSSMSVPSKPSRKESADGLEKLQDKESNKDLEKEKESSSDVDEAAEEDKEEIVNNEGDLEKQDQGATPKEKHIGHNVVHKNMQGSRHKEVIRADHEKVHIVDLQDTTPSKKRGTAPVKQKKGSAKSNKLEGILDINNYAGKSEKKGSQNTAAKKTSKGKRSSAKSEHSEKKIAEGDYEMHTESRVDGISKTKENEGEYEMDTESRVDGTSKIKENKEEYEMDTESKVEGTSKMGEIDTESRVTDSSMSHKECHNCGQPMDRSDYASNSSATELASDYMMTSDDEVYTMPLEFSKKTNKIKHLERQLEQVNQQLTESKDNLDNSQKDVQDHIQQNELLSADVKRYQKEAEDLSKYCEELQKQAAASEDKYDSALQYLEVVKDQLQEAEKKRIEDKSEFDKKCSDDITAQNVALRKEIEEQQIEFKLLNIECKNLKDKLEESSAVLQQSQDSVHHFKTRLHKIQKTSKKDIERLELEKQELEFKLEYYTDKNHSLNTTSPHSSPRSHLTQHISPEEREATAYAKQKMEMAARKPEEGGKRPTSKTREAREENDKHVQTELSMINWDVNTVNNLKHWTGSRSPYSKTLEDVRIGSESLSELDMLHSLSVKGVHFDVAAQAQVAAAATAASKDKHHAHHQGAGHRKKGEDGDYQTDDYLQFYYNSEESKQSMKEHGEEKAPPYHHCKLVPKNLKNLHDKRFPYIPTQDQEESFYHTTDAPLSSEIHTVNMENPGKMHISRLVSNEYFEYKPTDNMQMVGKSVAKTSWMPEESSSESEIEVTPRDERNNISLSTITLSRRGIGLVPKDFDDNQTELEKENKTKLFTKRKPMPVSLTKLGSVHFSEETLEKITIKMEPTSPYSFKDLERDATNILDSYQSLSRHKAAKHAVNNYVAS